MLNRRKIKSLETLLRRAAGMQGWCFHRKYYSLFVIWSNCVHITRQTSKLWKLWDHIIWLSLSGWGFSVESSNDVNFRLIPPTRERHSVFGLLKARNNNATAFCDVRNMSWIREECGGNFFRVTARIRLKLKLFRLSGWLMLTCKKHNTTRRIGKITCGSIEIDGKVGGKRADFLISLLLFMLFWSRHDSIILFVFMADIKYRRDKPLLSWLRDAFDVSICDRLFYMTCRRLVFDSRRDSSWRHYPLKSAVVKLILIKSYISICETNDEGTWYLCSPPCSIVVVISIMWKNSPSTFTALIRRIIIVLVIVTERFAEAKNESIVIARTRSLLTFHTCWLLGLKRKMIYSDIECHPLPVLTLWMMKIIFTV